MGILGADLTYEFEKIGVAIFEAGPVCLGPRMAHAGRILVALRVQWSGPLDPGSWVDSKIRAAIRSKNYRCDFSSSSQETLLIYQSLSIPNAFSPDNDGQNENWVIEGLGQFPNHELRVYSRWENLVLREAPYKNDWNGELRASSSSLNDQNLSEGTYFYILDLGNGQSPLKGFIYLKR